MNPLRYFSVAPLFRQVHRQDFMTRAAPKLEPRLRFPGGTPGAFGPGKAELLGRIASTGSIRSAAAQMGMSYNRAWTLVRTMNGLFRGPLVVATRGGGGGGGAALTPLGRTVLSRYAQMERACAAAVRKDWRFLRGLLR
jgi:molybdate transport system regulatory protein